MDAVVVRGQHLAGNLQQHVAGLSLDVEGLANEHEDHDALAVVAWGCTSR